VRFREGRIASSFTCGLLVQIETLRTAVSCFTHSSAPPQASSKATLSHRGRRQVAGALVSSGRGRTYESSTSSDGSLRPLRWYARRSSCSSNAWGCFWDTFDQPQQGNDHHWSRECRQGHCGPSSSRHLSYSEGTQPGAVVEDVTASRSCALYITICTATPEEKELL